MPPSTPTRAPGHATSAEKAARLSVVIVTCDRRDELLHSLAQLEQQETEFELVVVVNGSQDGSLEALREAWPEAVAVVRPSNEGACAGRNRGIEAASGEILVFLDDDASFRDGDALAQIARRFAADPELGVLAATSYLAQTGELERDAIPRREKRLPSGDTEVSYFCAVGFAARREVLETCGPFTEDLIYLGEELDLAWRAIGAEFRIVWAPDLVVLHRKSVQARPAGRWVYAHMRNRVRLAVLYLPWRYVASYAAVWWPWLLLTAIRGGHLGDYARGLRDGLRLMPATLRRRRCLSEAAIGRIRALDGRLPY